MPLRVSCRGPVLRLFSSWVGGWPGPFVPLPCLGSRAPLPAGLLLCAGVAPCWGGMRAPEGGAFCLGVGRPGSGALPSPTVRPLRRAARARYPLAVGAGSAGVGTRHQPHSARCCELALRAVGVGTGTTGGGGGAPFIWVWGVRGWALSHARPPVHWGMRLGPTTHWLWVRGVRCGLGDPPPTPQRALLQAGCARCQGGNRAPQGGASCLYLGRPGLGALQRPTARPLGRAAGAHYPLAVGAGSAGLGLRHQPHSALSWELTLRAVGAARVRPGGAPLARVWGVRGRALSHPRPPVL